MTAFWRTCAIHSPRSAALKHLATLAIAAGLSVAVAQDRPQPPAETPEIVTKGVRLLEGLVSSILSPTETEFRTAIKEGRMDSAAALYEREAKTLRGNKDVQKEVEILLTAQRTKAGKPLQEAVDALVVARESAVHLRDVASFKRAVAAAQKARDTYASTPVISEFLSSDPLRQRADAQIGQAKQVVVANVKDIYRAFSHDSDSFATVVPEATDEPELFRAALPVMLERVKTADEPTLQRLLKNTEAGWKGDNATRKVLADALIDRFKTDADPLTSLRAVTKVERLGLQTAEAANRPKLMVIDPVTRPNEAAYTFLPGHDGGFKSLQEARDAIAAQDRGATIIVHVDEAPTSRRIVEKKDIESKYVSGQRRVPNPQYEIARMNCQRAQSDAAAQRARNTISPAPGWGAVLQGLAEGIAAANVQKVCNEFAQMQAYTEQDEHASYSYVLSNIELVRTVKGRVLAWDASRAVLDAYPFNKEDKYTYRVAYGRKDNDRGSSVSAITDAELESEAAMPLKLDAMEIASGVTINGKTTHDKSQYATVFAPPAAAAPTAITMQGDGGARAAEAQRTGGTFYAVATTVAPARGDPLQQDSRAQSVVVVLNPKGSIGAGFYVDATDVLTNYHVVEGTSTVELRNWQGELFTGRVIRRDIQLDLALLRVERQGREVQLANTVIRPGATVEAIGHPKGLFFSLTRGVVSAVREMKGALAPGGDRALLIQTDTAINVDADRKLTSKAG